ncbi:hypothetical protein HYW66_01385 [Candidatus Microgenomates bacterium]|nr:hypothetical protein [Candidatus Microgenomates bacterium]
MATGVLNQLSFKRETTWGTPVVPDKSIGIHFGDGIQTDNDIQLLQSVKNQLAKNYHAHIGARKHEGEYEMDLFTDHPGYFILGALGAILSAVKIGETIVFEHDITETETKPSFTIEQVVGENVRRYAGAIFSGFKISGNAGEVIILNAPVMSKSQTSATKITPAYSIVRPYNFVDAQVKIAGVAVNEVENFELEYTNNLAMLHTVAGSNDPTFSYIQGSEVSGKLELYLNNNTLAYYNDYLAKNEKAIDIILTGDAIGVGSNNKIEISVPRCVFTTGSTPLAEDYNLLTIEFQGIFDTATNKLISAKITNLLANYN